jgi:hypothetical protein
MTLIRLLGQVNRKPGLVGAARHAVVARAEAAADQHGELGHARGGDGGDQLGPVLGDAAGLVLSTHHEARDVLQEHQRDAALARQLDEVRRLLRALAEEHAVVGEDRDGKAPDRAKPHTSVAPYSALNGSKLDPSTTRAITS